MIADRQLGICYNRPARRVGRLLMKCKVCGNEIVGEPTRRMVMLGRVPVPAALCDECASRAKPFPNWIIIGAVIGLVLLLLAGLIQRFWPF
jgi:hypothetical protein